jgi:lipopolysaccharide export system permease protein
MGAIGQVDPVLAQWVPFTGFLALSLWFYYVLAYRPGGQPIGALEVMFSKIAGLLAKLRPRFPSQTIDQQAVS